MANLAAPNVVFRIKKGGSDSNGGGTDPTVSGFLSTTLNGAINSSQTTMTVASAAGFPSTTPPAGGFWVRIGQPFAKGYAGAEQPTSYDATKVGLSEIVFVTAGFGTTTWTIQRGALGTTAQAWASGTTVDCDCSRGTQNIGGGGGANGTSNVSTTFSDSVYAIFDATYVGQVLNLISGTNSIPGSYVIQSVTNATTIVLDRACSSGAMTNGAFTVGGAWANPVVHPASAAFIAPGNTVYIAGVGTEPSGAPTSDYTHATATLISGTTAAGQITFCGENGRPVLKGSTNSICTPGSLDSFIHMYFAGAATSATAMIAGTPTDLTWVDCIFDQNGFDQTIFAGSWSVRTLYLNCEMTNTGSPAAHANPCFADAGSATNAYFYGCNFHDLSAGVWSFATTNKPITAIHCIFSNCGGTVLALANATGQTEFFNCTFDSNTSGHCISMSSGAGLNTAIIMNCLFSNNTGVGTTCIVVSGGSGALNDSLKKLIDFNAFYNNANDVSGISYGANDVKATNPGYLNQANQDYTLNSSALFNKGSPLSAFPQHKTGKSTTMRNYIASGAVQPNPAARAGGLTGVSQAPSRAAAF